MLASYTNTIGKTVRDIDQGTALGEVTGLLIDPGRQRAGAAILEGGKAIRTQAIHSLGRDGEEVGVVEDVLFDCFTGELQFFVVSGGSPEEADDGWSDLPRGRLHSDSRP